LKRKRSGFMQGEPPSWTRGWHRQNSASGGGIVHKCMRNHMSEGAAEPSRDGPGPVGPSRPTWPSSSVGSPPFPCTLRISNPKFMEVPPFTRRRAIRTERPSTS
jgi:hypothetical protein